MRKFSFCEVSVDTAGALAVEREVLEKFLAQEEPLAMRIFQLKKSELAAYLSLGEHHENIARVIQAWGQGGTCLTSLCDKTFKRSDRVARAMEARIGKESVFFLKSEKDGQETNTHEFFLSLFVVNDLCKDCPAFCYTYGILPVEVYDDHFMTCIRPGRTAVMEMVKGDTLRDSLRKLSPSVLVEIVVQLESALNLAYRRFRFTHYDLKADNVMVTVLTEPKLVPIYHRSKVAFLSTYYLVRIIDCEYAFAEIDGHGFGFERGDLSRLFIYSDRPYPMYDTYKFLCCLGAITQLRYRELYENVVIPLFVFFGDVDVEPASFLRERLRRYRKSNGDDYCHCDNRYQGRTHEEFLDHLFAVFPLPLIETLPVRAPPVQDFFSTVFSLERAPENSKDYFRAFDLATQAADEKFLTWLGEHTDFEEIARRELPRMLEKLHNVKANLHSKNSLVATVAKEQLKTVERWLLFVPFSSSIAKVIERVLDEIYRMQGERS